MKEFTKLIKIMADLRDQKKGCPWDLKQNEDTLKEYILEEAYELVEAIENNSSEKKVEELGDLLLQIVFLSQINQEIKEFSLRDVLNKINSKLITRHPHIFSATTVKSAREVKVNWEKIKRREKGNRSILSDYPEKMPALLVAKRISEQASSVGFDWQDSLKALAKVEEEINELKKEITKKEEKKINEEIGDIIFSLANVARLLNINPEFALRKTNEKFKRRFRYIENELQKAGQKIENSSLEKMEELWQQAKQIE